jgi:hypothetical protein
MNLMIRPAAKWRVMWLLPRAPEGRWIGKLCRLLGQEKCRTVWKGLGDPTAALVSAVSRLRDPRKVLR